MKVTYSQEAEIADDIVGAVADALIKDMPLVFEGQHGATDRPLAVKVAAAAIVNYEVYMRTRPLDD